MIDRLCVQTVGGPRRHAFTLTELLVVVALLLLITIAAVGMILPGLAERRVREASRTLQAVLVGARDRALASGRVRGIRLVRSTVDPWEVDTLIYVGVPEPYGLGTVQVQNNIVTPTGPNPNWDYVDPGQDGVLGTPDDAPRVVPGLSFIRFNYVGPFYRIQSVAAGQLVLSPELVAPNLGPDTRYQIFGPVRPLGEPPIRLPSGIVIDVRTEMPPSHPLSVANNAANANLDVPRSRGIPNQVPPPAYVTNGVPPQQWPPMDILFSPTGNVVGLGARTPYIHFWLGEQGDKGNPGPDGQYGSIGGLPDDVGPTKPFRMVTLNTRTGAVTVTELARFTGTRPGFPEIYLYLEDRLDKTTIAAQ